MTTLPPNVFLAPIHVPVSVLPAKIQQILKDGKFNCKDITVYRRDMTCPAPSSGHGERSTVTTYNEDTGKTQDFRGSFGGANMFTKTIDDVKKEVHLKDGDWLITVTSSYPKNHAHLVCNETTAGKLKLPSTPAIEKNEGRALNFIWHNTTSSRKEFWPREFGGVYEPTNPLIVSLAGKGLVKVTKAGAVSITSLGKIAHDKWAVEILK